VSFARLHHRIYLSLFAVALLSVAGAAFVMHALPDRRFQSPYAARLVAEAELVAHSVAADGASPVRVRGLGERLRLHALVLDPAGRTIAASADPPLEVSSARLPRAGEPPRWVGTSRGPAVAVALEDGRVAVVSARGHPGGGLLMLGVFFVLLAAGCIPVARGLSRRLQVLERGFADLGSGRLSTRVAVEGRDEIASLAERFNASAERIERLVESQRRVLLSASHELRSPLTRIRMALELIRERAGAEVAGRVADAIADVGELDALVDDLLLASRIETDDPLASAEELDLAEIVAEEGARVGARLDVTPARLVGDGRLLRRLARNLFDNARRHGGGTEITAGAGPLDGAVGARLWVADRGPGVPAEDRERIFLPFHRGSRPSADATGVGLGLALVRQIAERHGGTVTCGEGDGGGARFEVVLPSMASAGSATIRPPSS
jgi:signal transduction histidine kinase